MNPKIFAYLTGILSGICGNLAAFGFIPSEFMPLAGGICATLLSLGIVSASHSDSTTPLGKAALGSIALFFLMALGFSACSQAQIQHEKQVIATFDHELKTVIITGCKDEPEIKVAVDLFAGFYPPSESVVTIGEAFADRFCARVLELSKQQTVDQNSTPK